MEFSLTFNGKKVIRYEGYEYIFGQSSVGKFQAWRCRKKGQCKSYLHTDFATHQTIIKDPTPHSHEPDPIGSEKRHVHAKMITQMKNANAHKASAKDIVTSVLTSTPAEVRARFGKLEHIVRMVKKHCPYQYGAGEEDNSFEIPQHLMSYILYDKYDAKYNSRMIAVGEKTHAAELRSAEMIIGDVGFKQSLPVFKMLYTWYAKTEEGYLPCVHFLLCDFNKPTFCQMINVLHDILGGPIEPETVLVDFDVSRVSSIRAFWPETNVRYAFSSFSEFVVQRVNKSKLAGDYENCDLTHQLVNCLIALALVPRRDVLRAFMEIYSRFPDTPEHQELLTYFQKTFIRGLQPGFPSTYSIHMWNSYDFALESGPSTTSVSEDLYLALSEVLEGETPSVNEVLETLVKFVTRSFPDAPTTFSEATRQTVSRYAEFQEKIEYLAELTS